jgi:hypothetical protein
MRNASIIAGVLLLSGAVCANAAAPAASAGDKKLIASAMRAAPAAVSKNAAVIATGTDGKMRTVREGANGFTCMADNPETPGPDPMCGDKNAMEWIDAWVSHKNPPDKIGFMYMLSGGTDASNTDPYATKPDAKNHWVSTGPHVMIVGPGARALGYSRDADPNTKEPYVMWAGTPYEHVMIPVK